MRRRVEAPGFSSHVIRKINPFLTNVPFMDKPDCWFLLAKCFKNTCGRVTFQVKMQVIDLHLFLKCHSSTSVFQRFC